MHTSDPIQLKATAMSQVIKAFEEFRASKRKLRRSVLDAYEAGNRLQDIGDLVGRTKITISRWCREQDEKEREAASEAPLIA